MAGVCSALPRTGVAQHRFENTAEPHLRNAALNTVGHLMILTSEPGPARGSLMHINMKPSYPRVKGCSYFRISANLINSSELLINSSELLINSSELLINSSELLIN